MKDRAISLFDGETDRNRVAASSSLRQEVPAGQSRWTEARVENRNHFGFYELHAEILHIFQDLRTITSPRIRTKSLDLTPPNPLLPRIGSRA